MWTGLAKVLHQGKNGAAAVDQVLAGEASGPTRRVTLLPIGAADGQTLVSESPRAGAALAQLTTDFVTDGLAAIIVTPEKLDSWLSDCQA